MKSGAEYVASLKALKPRVFYMGERLESPCDHPAIAPHVRAAAVTYDLAMDPRHAGVTTAKSTLTGETISRFTHLFGSPEDLVTKIRMLRLVGQETGTCFQRCVGLDTINAIWSRGRGGRSSSTKPGAPCGVDAELTALVQQKVFQVPGDARHGVRYAVSLRPGEALPARCRADSRGDPSAIDF